jgi:hypothetical protein
MSSANLALSYMLNDTNPEAIMASAHKYTTENFKVFYLNSQNAFLKYAGDDLILSIDGSDNFHLIGDVGDDLRYLYDNILEDINLMFFITENNGVFKFSIISNKEILLEEEIKTSEYDLQCLPRHNRIEHSFCVAGYNAKIIRTKTTTGSQITFLKVFFETKEAMNAFDVGVIDSSLSRNTLFENCIFKFQFLLHKIKQDYAIVLGY